MARPLFLCRSFGCLILIVLLVGFSGCKKQEATEKTEAATRSTGSKELQKAVAELKKGWSLEDKEPSLPTVDGPALNAPTLNAPVQNTSMETAVLSPSLFTSYSPSAPYQIASAEGVFATDYNLNSEEGTVVLDLSPKAGAIEDKLKAEAATSALLAQENLKKTLDEWERARFVGYDKLMESLPPDQLDVRKGTDFVIDEEPKAEEPEEGVVEVIKEPGKLGDPLVDNLKDLGKPLNKNKTVWVDKKKKQVIMVGRVVQRNAPLEMFVCPKGTKEHESILAVETKAMVAHAALLVVGAKPGHPVQYRPEYQAATGTPIAIDVVWKDAEGKIHKAKAQDWIQNAQTKKPMKHNWVFAGSSFWKDNDTGKELYLAEQGDFICVSNFPTAMLDLPIKSSDKDDALMFQAWEKRIPPLGTPVTIIMKPILKPEKKASDAPVKTDEPKSEKKVEK